VHSNGDILSNYTTIFFEKRQVVLSIIDQMSTQKTLKVINEPDYHIVIIFNLKK
jgi:hypothetical protein